MNIIATAKITKIRSGYEIAIMLPAPMVATVPTNISDMAIIRDEDNTKRDSTMNESNTFAPLNFLRAVRFAGDDAATFLQGQLTADTLALPSSRWVRAAYCSLKGRVIASMLLGRSNDAYIAILCADIADDFATRLARFVLRAKVKITVFPSGCVTVAKNTNKVDSGTMKTEEEAQFFNDDGWLLRVTENEEPVTAVDLSTDSSWQQEQIFRGIPWVGREASELFIPQHINFELLDGVNFKKGCYVGQEIIARLHYLGKIKRRGYVVSGEGAPPPVGEKINGGEVVNAADDGKGGFVVFISAPCAAAESWEWGDLHLQLLPVPYSLQE